MRARGSEGRNEDWYGLVGVVFVWVSRVYVSIERSDEEKWEPC